MGLSLAASSTSLALAWSSAAWFLLLRACLGLFPDAPRGRLEIVAPRLPPWLDEVLLEGRLVREELIQGPSGAVGEAFSRGLWLLENLTGNQPTPDGGVVLAVARELGVPVRWVGVGEAAEDLLEFDPDAFARALLETLA